MMTDLSLLSPTFIPSGTAGNNAQLLGKRLLLRKTVDYHATALRFLENRIWQRDSRDISLIQPDSTYYNDLCVPRGLSHAPVNVVTTKFVKACTNKTRSPIFSTSWVPDGRRLVTGASSGEFTLWNGINFNFESIIQAHDCAVRSINWSHNGKWMVTTDDRGFIKYWQINFNNVHTYQAHSEPVRSSSFSPTDSKLATCSDDGTVRVFDFLSCREEHVLRGHGADVKCLDWHPRKCLLASGSKDNQQPVKLWDPKMGQSVTTIHAHKATVMDIKWNRNGNWFATASRDFLIKLYDLRTMKEFAVLKGHKKDVNTISWHPIHEKVFASGGSDGAILFWLVGNDREIGGMESAHEGFVWTLSWHPLGHLLCSGANDHTCKFWCRNKPGEELKDKYNSFHNPFFLGEEMEMSNLPGMNIDPMRGPPPMMMPPPTRDAITLPPPPSAVSPWRPGASNESGLHVLPGPRLDVPVLGADIIAETFADKGRGDTEIHFPNQPAGGRPEEIPSHLPPPPPPPIPLLNDGPPFELNERKEHWGRPHFHHPTPPFGGPRGPPPDEMGGSRYNWHRNDYHHPRRPSFEDEGWSNPFVYRREPNGPHRVNHVPPTESRRPSQEMRNFSRPDEFGRPPPEEFGRPPPEEFGRPPPEEFGRPPPEEFGRPPPNDTRLGRPPPPNDNNDDRRFSHDRDRPSFHQGDPRQTPNEPLNNDDRRFDRDRAPLFRQGDPRQTPTDTHEDRHFSHDGERPQFRQSDPRQVPNEPLPPNNDDRRFDRDRPSFRQNDPRQTPNEPLPQRGPPTDEHFSPANNDRRFQSDRDMGQQYPPQDPRQTSNDQRNDDPHHFPPHSQGHPPPHGYNSSSSTLNYQPPPNIFQSEEHYNDNRNKPQDSHPPSNQFQPPPRPSDPRQRGGGDEHHFPQQGRPEPSFGHGGPPPPHNFRSRESFDRQFDGHYQKGRDYQEGGRIDPRFNRSNHSDPRFEHDHGEQVDPRFERNDRNPDTRFEHKDPRFDHNESRFDRSDPRFDRNGPNWRNNDHRYDNHDDRRRDQFSGRGKNKDENSRRGRHRGLSNTDKDIAPAIKRPKNEIDPRSSRGHSKNK